MVQFFEFLNTCSTFRAISYMVFILLSLLLSYTFIINLIDKLFKRFSDRSDESSIENIDDRQQLND